MVNPSDPAVDDFKSRFVCGLFDVNDTTLLIIADIHDVLKQVGKEETAYGFVETGEVCVIYGVIYTFYWI